MIDLIGADSSINDGISYFSTPSDLSNAMSMRPLSLQADNIEKAPSSYLGGIFDPMDEFDWVSAITVRTFIQSSRHHPEGERMSDPAESLASTLY